MPRKIKISSKEVSLLLSRQLGAPSLSRVSKIIETALKKIPKNILNKKLQNHDHFFLSVSFVSPAAIQKANRTYRKKNKPTDVLAFERLSLASFAGDIGDILICHPIVKRNAKEAQEKFQTETLRVLIHGLLHLFGYDHEKSKKEERRMFALQEKILKDFI